jgi:hypothetical protein
VNAREVRATTCYSVYCVVPFIAAPPSASYLQVKEERAERGSERAAVRAIPIPPRLLVFCLYVKMVSRFLAAQTTFAFISNHSEFRSSHTDIR